MPPFGRSSKRSASKITGCVNLGDVNGDLIQIYSDRPLPPELSLPWRDATEDSSIFALLEWRTRISDFKGRDNELNEVLTWARSGSGISAGSWTGSSDSRPSACRRQLSDGGDGRVRAGAVSIDQR